MLSPKKTKFKKMHKVRLIGQATRNNTLVFGALGVQTLEPLNVKSKLLETLKKTILRYGKKKAKMWIKIFPDRSLTLRSKDSRMGSGKGSVKNWIIPIRPGTVFLELKILKKKLISKILDIIEDKLSINIRILKYKKRKRIKLKI